MDSAMAVTDEWAVRRVLSGGARSVWNPRAAVPWGRFMDWRTLVPETGRTPEEIAQESFLRALQSLDRLRDLSKFASWLFSIARNQCVTRQRSRWREAPLDDTHANIAAPLPDLAAEETAALLRAHIERLPERDRDMLLMYYFSGHNTVQIAVLLGISQKGGGPNGFNERARP